MFTSAIRTWPCASLDLLDLLEILRVDVGHDAFGDHGDAVAAVHAQALDDRPDERVDDRAQPDQPQVELLGDEAERRARGCQCQRQMARLAAHRDHEVPARRRLRVDHQVLQDVDAQVARGLIAERVDRRG
jgi:hypothetical protein